SARTLSVRVRGPFDLPLSLAAAASFLPVARPPSVLSTAIELDGNWVGHHLSGGPAIVACTRVGDTKRRQEVASTDCEMAGLVRARSSAILPTGSWPPDDWPSRFVAEWTQATAARHPFRDGDHCHHRPTAF